jgi:hypothetical protein
LSIKKSLVMKKFYKTVLSFVFAGVSISLSAQTTFTYTGSVQTYVVPACVTAVTIDASGAQGGGPSGGLGGRAQATIPVTSGSTLYIYVGGRPTVRPGAGSGGYNGGGAVNALPCGGGTNDGWGGGGASDVRLTASLTDRIIVGGGGGGSGWTSGQGGAGGGLTGSDGAASWIAGTQGFGATQSAGGAGGFYTGNSQSAGTGTLGQGGDAGPINTYCIGGGGGGGYYGGGGGYVSAGAGGSSYVSYPGSTVASTTPGFRSGDGVVTITPVSGAPTPGAISGTSSVCANASGNYSITSMPGATTYTWSVPAGSIINSGQGTTSINVTAGSTSGSISVTATYVCGTSSPSSLTLTVNPSPTVSVSVSPAVTVCAGASVTLSGNGATSYSWSGGITNGVPFVPSSTTTYTVTGTSAGCSGTATQLITVNALPTVVANSTAAAVCTGSPVTLSGSGASSYTWTGSVTDAVAFNPSSTNSYTVTGTDANGCVNTATTTVTVNALPTVVANSTAASVCNGAPVTLSGSGATSYSWSGGVMDAVAFNPASTNSYTVTGTDANGCVNTATTTVTVNAIPSVFANSTAAIVCSGSPVTLTGSGATSYTWTGGVMDAVAFNPSSTNTYTVTGTDANGCTNTAITTVTVNSLPTVFANSTTAAVCTGSSVTLTGSGAATYTWTGGITDAVPFNPTFSLTYTVTGTDANGCTNTATTTVIVNPLPTVTGTPSTTSACLPDAPVALTGTPAGGTWSGTGVTGSSFSPATAGLGAHTVMYTYTDANGCTNTATSTITVSVCASVADQTFENGVNVFPNPNNGVFTIQTNANIGELVIEITDMQGRVVYSSVENDVQVGFAKQIDLETESAGLYLMHMTANGQQWTTKIAVQK